MSVKQISVFLENKGGRLADVTKALGEQGIDISALSIADTTNFGILRMIVNNPDRAESALKEKGYAVRVSEVLAMAVEDTPGSLSGALDILEKSGIAIEYIYAFVGKTDSRALVVLKAGDMDKASRVLTDAGICVLGDEEVYKL